MSEEERKRILARVRKMLNLANDAAASEGERENAMRMAHATLVKYNLSLAEASVAEQDADPRGSSAVPNKTVKNHPWMRSVAYGIAQLFFCDYFYTTASKNRLVHNFVGRQSNIVTASELTLYVIDSILKESRKDRYADARWQLDFSKGAASRIYQRCKTLRAEAEQQSAATSSGTALVLASLYQRELEANKHYITDVMKVDLRHRAQRSAGVSTSGYDAGKQFGDRVSLNRQLGAGASTRRLK